MIERMNLIGAAAAIVFYITAILIFFLRIIGKTQFELFLGYVEFLLAIPMIYLLIEAPRLGRPALYYVQIGLMLVWLIVEALLDYILKIDFRQKSWMVISYVVLFFAGTGGMLGVASYAGKILGLVSIVLFLAMAVMAFIQRIITGK